MLKRIILILAVFAVILAGGPARAIVVCDSNGIEYNIRFSNREFIFGTASNLPCGGSAPLVGSFTRIPEGFFFSIFIDQNPLQPDCCEGFNILGIWAGNAGGGNWYDSREDPECTAAGTFTIGKCNALPLRSDPEPYPPPGLRY